MHHPKTLLTTKLTTLLFLLVVPSVTATIVQANTVPSASSTAPKTVPDGPDKPKDCPGCEKIYPKLLECQKITESSTSTKATRDCICASKSSAAKGDSSDSWYPFTEACASCLANHGSENGNGNGSAFVTEMFYDNLAAIIKQLFVSCTKMGDKVRSDGVSICAGNSTFEGCVGLRFKGDGDSVSWAGWSGSGDRMISGGNATAVLDLDLDVDGGGDAGVSSIATGTETGVGGLPTGSVSGNGSGNGTVGGGGAVSTTATTATPSSSAGVAGLTMEVVGRVVVGLAFALGAGRMVL